MQNAMQIRIGKPPDEFRQPGGGSRWGILQGMATHDPSTGPLATPTERPDAVASDAGTSDQAAPEQAAPEQAAPAGSPASPPSRRAGWLRAGAAAPPARRQRSPWVRLLVALTSSTALLGTAGLVAAAAIVPPIGARRTAREAAQQEVAAQLGTDERVVARAFASQRRWTDMWRESFGVVVATNRRLLYVGAPPTPLLRPREDGPTELLVESYPYDAAFTLEPRTLFRGYVRGLVLRTPAAQVDFIVDDGSWTSALRVAQASAAARKAVTRDEEVLSATTRARRALRAVHGAARRNAHRPRPPLPHLPRRATPAESADDRRDQSGPAPACAESRRGHAAVASRTVICARSAYPAPLRERCCDAGPQLRRN